MADEDKNEVASQETVAKPGDTNDAAKTADTNDTTVDGANESNAAPVQPNLTTQSDEPAPVVPTPTEETNVADEKKYDPQPGSGPGDAPDGGVTTENHVHDRYADASTGATAARVNKGADGVEYPEIVPADGEVRKVRTNNPSGFPTVEGNTFAGNETVAGYTGLNQSGTASGQMAKNVYEEVPGPDANHNPNANTRKYPPESFPEAGRDPETGEPETPPAS